MEKNLPTLRRIYNASFIAYFCILLGAALLRMIIYWGLFDFLSDDGLDYVFSFITQILLLGLAPVLLIGLYFKKSAKGTLEYLQVKKPKPYVFFAFVIGLVGFFASYFIAIVWNMIMSGLGWHSPNSAFSIYTLPQFLLAVVFTAVLPAVCEEITHRGLLLRAQKSTGASDRSIVVMGGILFGLFHMYVGQTFFTAILGGVMVFVTLKSKSILPAMFIHFTNNFMSVYLEFAYLNGLPGRGFFATLQNAVTNPAPAMLLIVACMLCVPAVFLLCWAFLRLARRAGDAPPPKPRTVPVYPYNPYAPYGANPNARNPYAQNPYEYRRPYNPYNQNPNNAPYPQNGQNAGPDPNSPFPEYEKPAPQQNPYGQPQNPYSAQPNPYGQPQNPFEPPQNPYAPNGQQPFNPYAPPQNAFVPPEGSAWQPIENPDKLAAPALPVFKPSAADNIFKYASLIFAGLITLISFILRL
ncbi:hypothetical protein FACS1894211_04770 [Clostridia bacterium]|nr:hypothetical protein FACS1894211_04770 [Clostridia bacterium]